MRETRFFFFGFVLIPPPPSESTCFNKEPQGFFFFFFSQPVDCLLCTLKSRIYLPSMLTNADSQP